MRLYDRAGNPVEVPDAEAPAKLASGEYGVPKGQAVPVYSPTGRLSTVQGEQLHAALSDGARLASQEDVARAKLQADYGGLGGGLAAAGLEGLSTATLGMSDVAGSALGGEHFKQARKNYREANPKSTIAGGLIGAVAPIAFTGGAAAPEEAAVLGGTKLLGAGTEAAETASALGRAGRAVGGAAKLGGKVLGAPAAAASGAARGVEHLVATALGANERTSLVTGLAKRAIAKGAGAATEGALIGAGQQLGEDALGDPDANGEKLYASGLHGALLGLGAGVGLSAAGELSAAVLGRAAPKLAGMAEEQAFRAINPRKAFATEADRIPGGAKGVGRRLLDEGVLGPGETLEQIAPKVSEARTKAGEKVGTILDRADEAGYEGPAVGELEARIRKEVLPELRKLESTNAAPIAKVEGLVADLKSFAEGHSPFERPGSVFDIGLAPNETRAPRGSRALELSEAHEVGLSSPADAALSRAPGELPSPIDIGALERPVHAPPVDEAEVQRSLKRLGPDYEYREVPISEIRHNTETWSPEKTEALRGKMGKTPLDPVRLSTNDHGELFIEDGIHRTALAKEMGYTHIGAFVERDAAERLDAAAEKGGRLLRMREPTGREFTSSPIGVETERAAMLHPDLEAGEAAIRRPIRVTPNEGLSAETAANARADYEHGLRLTFRQAQDFRSKLDDVIKWTTNPLAPVNETTEALKGVRRVLEDHLEQSGEKAAKQLGGSFLDEYKEAKLAYRQLTVADKAAQDALQRAQANRVLSPSDYGIGAAVGAGAIAHAAAGPIGALLAAGKGVAASLAHHAVRERGNSAAAVLLDKLSALRGVERASKAMDREMDRGIAGILREPGRAPPRVREMPEERHPYRAHSEAAIRASTNLEAHGQMVQSAVAPLAPHAPRIAQAFQGVASRAAQYLASKAPHRQGRPSIMPHLDEPRVSQTQEREFLLVAHAVHDPVSVLHDMSAGRATRAQVDALKNVYPKMYASLVAGIQERLADRTEPLAYEQRKQLALLFGAAADPAADPAFVGRMQRDFAPSSAPGGGPKGPPRGGAPKRKLSGQSDRLQLPGM